MAEFVNLDAKWLRELADDEYITRNQQTAVRLIGIAQRLESLDERLRNLEAQGDQLGEFARGVAAERERIFGRSNLPLQSVEVSPELRDAILKSNAPIKKIKRGVSGFDQPKPLKAVKRVSSPALQGILAGLKIDVSKLGGKV